MLFSFCINETVVHNLILSRISLNKVGFFISRHAYFASLPSVLVTCWQLFS